MSAMSQFQNTTPHRAKDDLNNIAVLVVATSSIVGK
jgi:hypothetical protein